MTERAKILGLPKNVVMKPVLLTAAERANLRAILETHYGSALQDLDSNCAILYRKLAI